LTQRRYMRFVIGMLGACVGQVHLQQQPGNVRSLCRADSLTAAARELARRWIFRKWEVGVWAGSSWLRIGASGGRL
jgi:hypothetical protein